MAKTAAVVKTAESRTYFLTYLVPATFTDSEARSLKDSVVNAVTKHKGTVVKAEDWGKRRMAYKIKHSSKWQTEAFYTHLTISLDPAQVQPLERDVYLTQNIMRHLLVLADEAGQPETQS